MGGAIKRPPNSDYAGPDAADQAGRIISPPLRPCAAALDLIAESSESLSRSRCGRARRAMVSNPVWEICERMAEVQALLHDHSECGKHKAADAVAKVQGSCFRARSYL